MRLQEMGLVSGTTRNELEKLTKAGASSTKIWETLKGNFMEFAGASEILQSTWKGRLNKLSDSWKKALAAMGDEILIFAKSRVDFLANSFEGLADSGWAAYFGRSVRSGLEVAERAVIKFVATSIPKVKAYAQKVKDAYAGIGTRFGASGGEGVAQVLSADISLALTRAVAYVAPHFFDLGIAVGKGVLIGMRQGISEGLGDKKREMGEWAKRWFPNFTKLANLAVDSRKGKLTVGQRVRVLAQTANPLESFGPVKFMQSKMNRDIERATGKKGVYSVDSSEAFDTFKADMKAQRGFMKRLGSMYFQTTPAMLGNKLGEQLAAKVQRVVVLNTEELKAPVKTQSKGGY
jgi:hypothetical protein